MLCLALLFICGAASADMRVWRDKSGTSFVGEFIREKFDKFTFKDQDKKVHTILISDMSDNDLTFIRTMVSPSVTVEVKIKREVAEFCAEAFNGGAGDISLVEIFSTVTVKKKSPTPFEGILKAEFYLVGDEVMTDHHKMLKTDIFAVRFPNNTKDPFVFESMAEAFEYEEYGDIGQRGNQYGGYALFVYAPDGSLLASDTNLGYLKDPEAVENFRKLRVGEFFKDNCKKTSVPRPPDHEYYRG